MSGFTPFKKHANKFNYTPRYYDPDLEEFRERRAAKSGEASESKGDGGYVAGQYIRRQREARNEQMRRDAAERKNRRMMGMVVVIVVVAIVIFVIVPRVAQMFSMAERAKPEPVGEEQFFDPYQPLRIVPNDYNGE